MCVFNSIGEVVSSFPQKNNCFVSLVGGGGKTTLMQSFAQELKQRGKRVLMTTSTKVQSPDSFCWKSDYIFTDRESAFSCFPNKPCVVLYAKKTDLQNKLISPPVEEIAELSKRYDYILCESDGSRHLPVKIHTDRDPVIYDINDYSVCVFGAWAIGKKACEYTFGPLEDKISDIVDLSFLDWYLTSEEGLVKRTQKNKRCIVITRSKELTKDYWKYFEMQHESVFFC